jgi:hypothetical protein
VTESTKSGDIILRSVSVPDSVRPGKSFTAEAVVRNGAPFVGPFDDDGCNPHSDRGIGHRLQTVFEGPEYQTKTDGPRCHKRSAVGVNDVTYVATFVAPDETGTVTVSAYVELPGSGKRTDRMESQVTVTADAPAKPEDRDDSGSSDGWFGDGDDSNNNGDSGPFADLESAANVGAALVVLLLLAWVLDSGADLAG